MDWFLLSLASAVLTAASAITEKRTLLKMHAMEFSAALSVAILSLSLPILPFVSWETILSAPVAIIYLATLLASVSFLLIAKGVRHMDVSESSPIMVIGPLFAAMFAFIFLGEKLTPLHFAGIAVLILGAYLLELKSHSGLLEPLKAFGKSRYVHYILLALLLYGITSAIDRLVLGYFGMPPLEYLLIAHFFLAVNFTAMMIIFHDGLPGIGRALKGSFWWIMLVAALSVGYRLAQVYAVAEAPVALVSAIKRTSALFAVIIGGEMFHEQNLLRKSLACAIMIIGAAMIIL